MKGRGHSVNTSAETSAKRSDSDDGEEQATTLKKPRHIGSPPSSAVDPHEQPRISVEDEDLANLQRQMDEYNLRNSQTDEERDSHDGEENDVEAAMSVRDDESQDL
ncbi:hypothetical protein FRC09_019292 [Ceratobasidium sp. 395]|nr:hypothetical protein FRC09_019292 [Ceratobasidium sp. 395]